jgi:hypothetical protein
MSKLAQLFTREPKATGRTHDFSEGNTWGWAFYVSEITNGNKNIRGHGFGPRVQPGDWVLLKNKAGGKPRYKLLTVEGVRDPNDMFFYTAVYSPPSPKDPPAKTSFELI